MCPMWKSVSQHYGRTENQKDIRQSNLYAGYRVGVKHEDDSNFGHHIAPERVAPIGS